MSFKTLQIRYQTGRSLPAPYAYFYTLTLTTLVGELGVDLAITYPNRDDIDDDELMAEGFTRDDDFSWTGRLPKTWLETVTNLAGKTRLLPVDEDQLGEDDDFWDVQPEADNGPVKHGRPQPTDDWQYLMQELIQAVYEVAGRERPFELAYWHVNPPGSPEEMRLTASFADRTVRVLTKQNQRESTRILPWPRLQRVMSAVYARDYDPDDAQPKRPRQAGHWLNLGGEEWYDVGQFAGVIAVLTKL